MGTSCHYHPTQPAQWVCPNCEVNYCGDCIETRVVNQYGKKSVFYFCPECDVKAERMAFEDTVIPFWNRLPQFFAYPFHLRPLGLIIVLNIASLIFSKLWLIGSWGSLFVTVIFFKYAFASLRNTANGSSSPPCVRRFLDCHQASLDSCCLGFCFRKDHSNGRYLYRRRVPLFRDLIFSCDGDRAGRHRKSVTID